MEVIRHFIIFQVCNQQLNGRMSNWQTWCVGSRGIDRRFGRKTLHAERTTYIYPYRQATGTTFEVLSIAQDDCIVKLFIEGI